MQINNKGITEMKITKEHEGEMFHNPDWAEYAFLTIDYVGKENMMVTDNDGVESSYNIKESNFLEPYTPPKKTIEKIMSPAIIYVNGFHSETGRLFETETEAKNKTVHFHAWPAKDGNGEPVQRTIKEEVD